MGKVRLSSKSSDINYPVIKPTLNLNFAASKTLDPRITFTRASTGTYVGSDGLIKYAVENEPRFEHDPVTGQCLGFLVEDTKTNYIINSDTPGPSGSVAGGIASIESNYTLPDGKIGNSRRVYHTNSNGFYVTITGLSTSTQYTLSFWIRNISGFDISSVYGAAGTWTINPSYIIPDDGKWYKIYISDNMISTVSGSLQFHYTDQRRSITTNANIRPFTILIWGAQLEQGTSPTSYIPTLSSPVTRAADSASLLGSTSSSWYNSTEGSLVSIGTSITSCIIPSSKSIIFNSNFSNKNIISNILYYPKTIQSSTLKTMNAYESRIVSNGLIIHLDSANPASYPGSGTIWNDLSGKGNNGTLINGPTYSSANGGSIAFDGTNNYFKCNNNLVADNLNNMTVSCWVYANWSSFTSAWSPIFSKMSNYNNGAGWDLGTKSDAFVVPNIYFMTQLSGGSSYKISRCSVPSGTYWMNITASYSGGTNNNSLIYINGVQQSLGYFNSGSVASTSTSSAVTLSARDGAGSNYSKVNIAQALIYDRALTATEIQQNFNATRARFGI